MVDIFKGLSIRLACVLQNTEADTYSAARDWLQHCMSVVKGSYLSLGSTAASCQRQFRRNKKSKRMAVVSVALGILREIEEKTASALLLRGIKRDGSFVYLWHYLKELFILGSSDINNSRLPFLILEFNFISHHWSVDRNVICKTATSHPPFIQEW